MTDEGPVCDHGPWEGWDEECAPNHAGDYAGAIRSELYYLWGQLPDAQRSAIGGDWSIRCDGIAYRIQFLSGLVGALPWEHVSVDTLLGGVYERVHQEAGITYPPIDWDRVREVRRRIDERSL